MNEKSKNKEVKELAFNKDEIRKSLDRSIARDESSKKEGEKDERDDS